MEKVLVTGANSLLAANVIRLLLERGYHVNGILRSAGNFKLPPHENLDLTEADIRDTGKIMTALEGCKYVIHCAATTREDLPRYKYYREINADATEELVKLSIEKKVSRFVFISSSNAIGSGTLEHPGNETMEPRKPVSDSFYAKSKAEANKRLLKYCNNIDIVILCPCFMLGPWDSKPSSGRIILMGLRKIIFHPPGGKNFIDVRDAAQGTVNSLKLGRNGETYLLASENLDYRSFFKKLVSVSGGKSVLICLPPLLLYLAGMAGSLLRFFSVPTELTLTNMRIICRGEYYSGRKAVEELGIELHPVEDSIKDAIEWFRENKMI